MSSTESSTRRAFPDPATHPRARLRAWFTRWIRRRGPVHPPLELGYRQIFILPTRFGWMIGVLLLAMLMGSLNFNNNLGLLTTFLVAGAGLLSMHLAHRNLDGLRIRSIVVDPVFAGDPLRLRVALDDLRERPREGLVIRLPDGAQSRAARLDAGATGEIDVEVPTTRRGWLEVGRLRLRTRWPLGWFEAWSWFWPEQRFLVWPRPADQAPALDNPASRSGQQQPGDESNEFHGLRDWREGDPLHRIAWKASQRHQHLLARQFTRPERGRLMLRLADAPAASREARIAILTRWVLEADRRQLDYGLDLGGERIEPAGGAEQRVRCLNALACLP